MKPTNATTMRLHDTPNPTSPKPNRVDSQRVVEQLHNRNKMRVDDTFFIVKKCVRRGLSTLDSNVACAIINSASMALEDPFIAFLASHIAKALPSSGPTSPLHGIL